MTSLGLFLIGETSNKFTNYTQTQNSYTYMNPLKHTHTHTQTNKQTNNKSSFTISASTLAWPSAPLSWMHPLQWLITIEQGQPNETENTFPSSLWIEDLTHHYSLRHYQHNGNTLVRLQRRVFNQCESQYYRKCCHRYIVVGDWSMWNTAGFPRRHGSSNSVYAVMMDVLSLPETWSASFRSTCAV